MKAPLPNCKAALYHTPRRHMSTKLHGGTLPNHTAAHFYQTLRRQGNFSHLHFYERREILPPRREIFPPRSWQPYTLSNLAPEGRQSRDLGSGAVTFILEEKFTSPGPNPTPLLLMSHSKYCFSSETLCSLHPTHSICKEFIVPPLFSKS